MGKREWSIWLQRLSVGRNVRQLQKARRHCLSILHQLRQVIRHYVHYRVKAYYVSDNVMQYSKPAQVVTCTLPCKRHCQNGKAFGKQHLTCMEQGIKSHRIWIYVKSGRSWKKLTTTSGKSYTAKICQALKHSE